MVPAVIAVILIFLFIQEKKVQPVSQVERPKLSLKHFDWRVKFFLVIATLFALGNSSDAFLILRAEQIGIPTLTIPVVYLLFNLVYSLAAIPAGMAADIFGRKRIILLGFVLFARLYYGFAVVANASPGWLWDHVSPAAIFYFGAATAILSALLFIVLMLLIHSSQRLT